MRNRKQAVHRENDVTKAFCLAFPIRVPGSYTFLLWELGKARHLLHDAKTVKTCVCGEENFHYGHDVRLTQIRHR